MLHYLKPSLTPIIPCNTAAYRKNMIFAKKGKGAKESYDWDVLMVYVDELKIALRLGITCLAVLENILLWRRQSSLHSGGSNPGLAARSIAVLLACHIPPR